jgi:hypothetical protein
MGLGHASLFDKEQRYKSNPQTPSLRNPTAAHSSVARSALNMSLAGPNHEQARLLHDPIPSQEQTISATSQKLSTTDARFPEDQSRSKHQANADRSFQPGPAQANSFGQIRQNVNGVVPQPSTYATKHNGAIRSGSASAKSSKLSENDAHPIQHAPRCYDHGCNGRVFSCHENYLRHLREKKGKYSVKCLYCGCSFTRRSNRDKHLSQRKCQGAPGMGARA